MTTAMKAKKELLASQVSNLVSDTNENLLRVNLSKFFTDLEAEIQKALIEYWNDTLLLQGQINLILSPIHEKHQEYYELIMTHKLQEFRRAQKLGERLVKREQEKVAMKAAQPVKFIHNENNLFGTLEYTEERLSDYTFTASQNTLNRVDGNINEILTTGYREGKGINEVSRKITERFDQLRTWEAKRIARTEIHTSQNMGIMNSYESLGVEYTQWSAAHDSRTRHSHIEIDGEIIPFGGTYSNKLRFPGDTSGPVEEWINCRCANAPFVLPAGMMAPSFSPFKESDLIPIETQTTDIPTSSLIQSEDAYGEINTFHKEYGNSHEEHGGIIDIRTGERYSPIFHGGKHEVNIPESSENGVSYVKTENCSFIHNHPRTAFRTFSHNDINVTLRSEKINHCLAISEKEVWILKTNPNIPQERIPITFIVNDFKKASSKIQFEHSEFKFDEKARLKKEYNGPELSKKLKEFDEYLKSDEYLDTINEKLAAEYSKVAKVYENYLSLEHININELHTRMK